MRRFRRRCGAESRARVLGGRGRQLTPLDALRRLVQDIRFVPLKQQREFNAAELLEFYKSVR